MGVLISLSLQEEDRPDLRIGLSRPGCRRGVGPPGGLLGRFGGRRALCGLGSMDGRAGAAP
jgi:hypothetical protein